MTLARTRSARLAMTADAPVTLREVAELLSCAVDDVDAAVRRAALRPVRTSRVVYYRWIEVWSAMQDPPAARQPRRVALEREAL